MGPKRSEPENLSWPTWEFSKHWQAQAIWSLSGEKSAICVGPCGDPPRQRVHPMESIQYKGFSFRLGNSEANTRPETGSRISSRLSLICTKKTLPFRKTTPSSTLVSIISGSLTQKSLPSGPTAMILRSSGTLKLSAVGGDLRRSHIFTSLPLRLGVIRNRFEKRMGSMLSSIVNCKIFSILFSLLGKRGCKRMLFFLSVFFSLNNLGPSSVSTTHKVVVCSPSECHWICANSVRLHIATPFSYMAASLLPGLSMVMLFSDISDGGESQIGSSAVMSHMQTRDPSPTATFSLVSGNAAQYTGRSEAKILIWLSCSPCRSSKPLLQLVRIILSP